MISSVAFCFGFLFLTLKLTKQIEWPWVIVLLPFWIGPLMDFIAFCFFIRYAKGY